VGNTDVTMSERVITIRLSGPQYRTVAKAITERLYELELPGTKQERDTLERAWNQIQAGWHRSAPSAPSAP
jgi:hypothetical protein